jgi:hypothetical protein
VKASSRASLALAKAVSLTAFASAIASFNRSFIVLLLFLIGNKIIGNLNRINIF